MKRTFILILLHPFVLFSQGLIQEKYKSYNLDQANIQVTNLRERIYSQIPKNYSEDIKRDRQTFLFAHEAAMDIYDMFTNGDISADHAELETYVNDVLKVILPSELKGDTVIHIFIAKDGKSNAKIAPTGHIFLNLGMIAELDNEAMLASLLCHELAHFFLKHSIIANIKAHRNMFGTRWYFNNSKFYSFSINSEYQADSLAALWMLRTPYDLNEVKHLYASYSREEQCRLAKNENLTIGRETTHPLSNRRKQRIERLLADHAGNKGEQFIVDKNIFLRLKNQSKARILELLLLENNYYTCIEKSFYFHLCDPFNKAYIYYLMEGIRRQCYSNPHVWSEPFITNQFYDSVMVNGKIAKSKCTLNLFHQLNSKYLSIDPEDTLNIIAKFYWQGDPKFSTYEQAFEYFYGVSQKMKINECILSNALSISKSRTERNKFLELYLLQDSIQYREFASLLLSDSLYASLDTIPLLVMTDFVTYLQMQNEYLTVPRQQRDSIDLVKQIFDSLSGRVTNKKTLSLSDLKESSPEEFLLLRSLHKSSFYPTVSSGEKIEMAILNPAYWDIFKKYQVNEVEFLMCNYSDPKGGTRITDYYRDLIDRGYTELFYPPQHRRYMEIYISSIRMKNTGALKTRYFYPTHFGNMRVGVPEIIDELSSRVKARDSFVLTLDEKAMKE